MLTWTDPHGLLASKDRTFLYFVRVIDDDGYEYRYIGKTKDGQERLVDYRRNIARIFAGLPRRKTVGQEKYRAVHLALAKACKHGWRYELYPLEAVDLQQLGALERQRIAELKCDLNGASAWNVEQFDNLSVRNLVNLTAASSAP